jgi:predicted TIM-barrel fold metal-dependent hydrolase
LRVKSTHEVSEHASHKQPRIALIIGGIAPGKSTLARKLGAAQFSNSILIYGMDLAALSWPDSVDTILGGEIADAEKEAILGGNLTKLLKL